MAEAKLISKEWSDEVKLFLKATTEGVPDDRGNVRLSKALRDAKKEAYTPQMVSLGPYHHSSLKDESVGPFHKRLTHLSQMEMYKLQSSREAAGKNPEIIEKMFLEVSHQDTISELEKFYDWEVKEEEDVSNFAWMMMVDALFLSYFLKSGFDNVDPPPESSVRRGASIPAKASIRCDIVKLENQIPLSLVKKLEEIVPEMNTLDSLLPSQMKRLSSFQVSDIEIPSFNEKCCIHKCVSTFLQVSGEEQDIPLACCQGISNGIGDMVAAMFSCCSTHPAKQDRQDKGKGEGVAEKKDDKGKGEDFDEKHLLGCIHRHVSSFLRVSDEEEKPPTWCQWIPNVMGNVVAGVFGSCYTHPARLGRPDFLEKYSAKELAKAGIKFKSFKKQGKIRFSKNSDTLYLPQITIFDTYTEVLLRNLLVLEFNESGRERRVSNYVELMNCLIDTPEDVRLLRESHVIERQSMMITDEYVAKMWDGMSKPFFLAGFLELPGGLKGNIKEVLMKNYYKTKIKTQLSKLHRRYLSGPMKVFRGAGNILLC